MRILHFIASIDPATGGPVEGLRQRCAIYRQSGHEVEVASLDAPEFVKQCGFPAQAAGLGPGRGTYGYSRHAVGWLKENLSRFDLVLVNGVWNYNTRAAWRALAGSGTPWAVFPHGMLDPYFKRRFPLKHLKKTVYWNLALRRILRDATAVLYTCEEERILARQSFAGYSAREMVVPYGTFGPDCDTARAGEQFLTRWPELRGKRLAISLSRIHPKKGTDLLIEAFAATLSRDADWHLVIAGPDKVGWRKELEALAERLGIAHRITWTGSLEGTIKWGAFSAGEVFVLPSHQENFGIVVAEALSCGLPVIVSDKVNIWREVMNHWAGLVGDDTIAGTTASLNRWSALNAEEIAALRVRARKCFQSEFDYNFTSKRVIENVELLAGAAAGQKRHRATAGQNGA